MALRILITGVTGFIGKALSAHAVHHGFSVRGALHKAGKIPDNIEVALVGEINGETDWTSALSGVDVVIHLAARVHVMREESVNPIADFRKVNVAGTDCLARAAAVSGVRRLVYVSSIKVNGEETVDGFRYTELDSPLPNDPYGISKWEAEQALHRVAAETGLEVVIVRPPLVYGAGVKGNFAQMLKVLVKGIPLPLASVHNLRSLVYIGNFTDALLKCATHTSAAGKTYLVSDGEDISTPDLLRQLGAAMGKPARLLPCPPVLLKLVGRLLGKSDQVDRLLGSLQVDSSKIRRELGWQSPFTLQEGLRLTIEG
ncbi:MAG: NAD-dependent dehydratase [Gallionellales bacterium 35-53-114]|jgi:nucleoside-diphosphate-sugar epimerase|nr:MAG: NAD-dependent dehydratase [Gallionellales bacterium 35-53-114]OYZ63416.1 MAG: NAD-dependent dehydratase [Gallionellales bacterium 24-53-125]OZB10972.1 MAG: NAD-dependent dehydratase [Gallionellales bacterium 39-52-133]HQS58844.1 SDR family oxidoreductase [Gallionellaceae bacterium]HQS75771.1 SDR family oxidoreductase [Gallionellaceae bacterium]